MFYLAQLRKLAVLETTLLEAKSDSYLRLIFTELVKVSNVATQVEVQAMLYISGNTSASTDYQNCFDWK